MIHCFKPDPEQVSLLSEIKLADHNEKGKDSWPWREMFTPQMSTLLALYMFPS